MICQRRAKRLKPKQTPQTIGVLACCAVDHQRHPAAAAASRPLDLSRYNTRVARSDGTAALL
eukprot:307821-Prorocentrum_minimum.AAC.1